MKTGLVVLILLANSVAAQDRESQLPKFLQNSYAGIQLGYIDPAFTNEYLEPGFEAEKIYIKHLHLGLKLVKGYRFNENLSAQLSFMRPAAWINYENVNGDNKLYAIWMTIGGLTIKPSVKLGRSWKLYGEGGFGLVSRQGFKVDSQVVEKDASFASILLGAGIEYKLQKNWQLTLNATYNPPDRKRDQPKTVFISAGVNYNLGKLNEEDIKQDFAGYNFPDHIFQVGVSSNITGYAANKFFSSKLPIFWAGDVRVKHGIVLSYQRNVFHTRRVFSLNWGANISYWNTIKGSQFCSAAVYPMFRFTLLRSRSLDGFLQYSLAGPAFVSKRIIDGHDTGRKFTFQDLMGMGFLLGSRKNISMELLIGHYSNGNIFPTNAGIMLPPQVNLGYCF